MTIQRQYSLPNCTLILEGMGDTIALADAPVERPPLSVLLNAECRFTGQTPSLTGGREFLEQLIATVSQYAQGCLSGISHNTREQKAGMVQLELVEPDVHRLTVYPKSEQSGAAIASEPIQLNLRTLQLFDLVEAIDQLLADTQTLPDLTADLTPVSKRAIASQEPTVNRVAPIALGLSSLAAASIALFFLPIPDVRPPEPEPTTQESPPTANVARPEPLVSPTEASPTPTSIATPEADLESANPTNSAAPASVAAAEAELESLLASTPPIADVEQLDQLTDDLRRQLSDAWDREHTFDQELVYRVGVAENGDLLGFKQTDQASIDYTDETPLLDLLYLPVEDDLPRQEAIAQFRVVFTPSGVVEVSPWYGRPAQPDEPE